MSENTENTLTAYLGVEFQQKLMWQLLVEPEFAETVLPNLAIEYFDDPNLKRLLIIILEYYKEFEKVPNFQNQSIHQAINRYKTPNNIIEEESLFAVIKRIELWNERIINKLMLHDGDVVQKQTNSFIKQQEYRKIGEYIIGSTKSGEIKSKYTIAYIEEKFQKISHIGEEKDDCEDVTEGIDNALRKEFRDTIPTGVEVIDALTDGGLGRGEIGLILTASGVGKSTLLTKIANTAYEDEKNVAQIIFEDTKDQIKRKHYTIWSKSALSKLNDEEENIRVKKIVHEKVKSLKGKGRLIIKKFSQENTTMMDVRNWMLSYQKKYGFKFDILVLDYLDCLESHKKSPDRTEAELHIVKSFEALASDFDIPAWSAIQGGRSSFGAEFVEAQQTGGSIKRIQKAHFFMSVAKTADQKEAQLANIRILKARFAQDGQTFQDCYFNNDTMEIRIEDDRYKYGKLNKGKKHHDETDIDNLESDLNKIHVAASNSIESILIEKANSDAINDNILGDLKSMYIDQNATVGDIKINEPEIIEFLETSDEMTETISEIPETTIKLDIQPDTDFMFNFEEEPTIKSTVVEYNVIDKNDDMYTKSSVSDVENALIDPDEIPTGHKTVREMLAEERKRQDIMMKKEK